MTALALTEWLPFLVLFAACGLLAAWVVTHR